MSIQVVVHEISTRFDFIMKSKMLHEVNIRIFSPGQRSKGHPGGIMRSCQLIVLSILALLVATACSDGGAETLQGEGPAMSRQMAEVVVETDAMVGGMLDLEIDRADSTRGADDPITVDISFSRTRPCPLGGEVSIDGSMHRTFDPATLTGEATFSGTKALTDCAFMKEAHVITVNGTAQWDAFRRRVDRRPDGLQTTSYSGSIAAVRDDGEERSCEFSVEAVVDPAAHTRTVSGTICGNEFSRTVTWNPGGGEG